MRFLTLCFLFGMIGGTGCIHRKAAKPHENFSDVPGFPSTQAPVQVSRAPKSPPPETKTVKTPKSAEPKTPAEKLIVTPDNGLVGKVEMVNQNARYAVLSFPIGHLPAMEQRLNEYRRGLKVGEVKVTGPQIEDNVVADIVEGESAGGDEVRDK